MRGAGCGGLFVQPAAPGGPAGARGGPGGQAQGLRHGQGGEGEEGEGGTLAPAHQGPPGAAEGPVPPDLRRVTDLHSAEITREFEYLDRVNFPCALLPLFNNKCVKPEKVANGATDGQGEFSGSGEIWGFFFYSSRGNSQLERILDSPFGEFHIFKFIISFCFPYFLFSVSLFSILGKPFISPLQLSLYCEGDLRNLSNFLNKRKEFEFYIQYFHIQYLATLFKGKVTKTKELQGNSQY